MAEREKEKELKEEVVETKGDQNQAKKKKKKETAIFLSQPLLLSTLPGKTKLDKKKPKQVYHVPKKPELDLLGRTGVVAEVVRFQDGAELSATMPYRVVLDDDEEAKAAAAAGGKKPMKVTVHLSGGEIELLA